MSKSNQMFIILALIGMLVCLLVGYTLGTGALKYPPVVFKEVK